jgi:hypothetical protein
VLGEKCALRQEELAFQVNDRANYENNHENNIPVPFPLPGVRLVVV